MGHTAVKDVYKKLGQKIDGLTVRTPLNDTFYSILKELYSEEEAKIIVKMPYSLSNLNRISKTTGKNKPKLQGILNDLCHKGLILDIESSDERFYMPSPMVIGIFEFTMMRTGPGLDRKKIAKLFSNYMEEFFKENASHGGIFNILRVVPYDDQISQDQYVEVMDYEKASELVDQSDKFAIGICSCRHEKHHLKEKKCDTPLEVCAAFGIGADYLIRNKLGKESSKSEMRQLISDAKKSGLVYSADNVQKKIQNICLCCGCCCNYLAGFGKYGIPNSVLTSNYIANINDENCTGCGKCAKACPIDIIEMVPNEANKSSKKKLKPEIDIDFCLGCGVCASRCKKDAMVLVKREKRFITPEKTCHKIILQSLERGNLQNLIFDNPQSVTQNFMRGLLGGFLRLDPVKKTLMSDTLRSVFLKGVESGIKAQGMGWVTDL